MYKAIMIMDPDHSPIQPFLVETPVDALGPIVRENILIDNRTFVIARPGQSDHLMDDPVVQSAFRADEYLPYWTELWPAARMLAKIILRETWISGLEVLEVGCGLGLAGIAALIKGHRVIFSDYDATALRFAAFNARLNGFDNFQQLQMDWRFPPPGLKVPVLLMADLIYELRNINPLVALIKKVLLPGGVCFLTDPPRLPTYNLREALDGEGMPYTTQTMKTGEPGRRHKGIIYRINLPPRT
ncbi:MAG TPA: methyltransferase domain-containing protein [Gemmataceae bacterium]|nr:methyltransferase domain-containing protein [Gemmataceae bacterium]